MEITEFLLARIAEDEAIARAAVDDDEAPGPAEVPPDDRVVIDPDRMLAECEAKRQIVEEVMGDKSALLQGWGLGLEHAIKHLAIPYADHPEYDEAWRP